MDKLIRVSIIGILLLVSLGCATSRTNTKIPLKSEIDKTKIIYVMQAKDGAYGGTVYEGSGLEVSKRIMRTLRKVQPLAQLVEETNETDAVKIAKEKGASYLVVPDLLHWEDRATAWSGYRDKVKIELRLLRLDPIEVISAQSYYTTNNSITFLSTKPEDLLNERFDKFIYQFLGK
jgi:hypothetical protein